jgi:hypothetical protein
MRFVHALGLVAAAVLLVGVSYALYRLWEVIELGRSQKLPPTMYGEYAGMAIAFACLAAICIHFALNRRVASGH